MADLRVFPLCVTLLCTLGIVTIMVYGNEPGSFPSHVRFDGSMLPSRVQSSHSWREGERILREEKGGVEVLVDCLQSSGKLGSNSCAVSGNIPEDTETDKIIEGKEVEIEKQVVNLQRNSYFKDIVDTLTRQERTKTEQGRKSKFFQSEKSVKSEISANLENSEKSVKSEISANSENSEKSENVENVENVENGETKVDQQIDESIARKMVKKISYEGEVDKTNKRLIFLNLENDKILKAAGGEDIDEAKGDKKDGKVKQGFVEREGGKDEASIEKEGVNKEGVNKEGVNSDVENKEGEIKHGLVEKKDISFGEDVDGAGGSAMDKACVSVWPSLCKFVDELEMPPMIDGATGETITLGIYKVLHKLHRDLPYTALFGFGPNPRQATSPGPTISSLRYIPTHIQWENHIEDDKYYTSTKLPTSQTASPKYGGIPIVIHLHGGETEPSSDGHPEAWFTRKGETGATFKKSLYSYHNQQPSSTMWFHDHTEGLTALGIYHGLTGFYHLTDPADRSLNLPSGTYDLSLNIQNKVISEHGYLHTSDHQDAVNYEVRDLMVVNGKAWPYSHVDQAKYRLRFLNGCNLRLLNMSFLYTNETQTPENSQLNLILPTGTVIPFHQIASDGGFLNSPVPLEYIELAPAERAEIVVDFTGYEGEVWFYNSDDVNASPDGSYNHDLNLGAIIKFFVGQKVVPSPPIATVLNSIPDPNTFAAQRTRWLHIWEIPVDKTATLGADVIDGTLHLLNNMRFSDNATEVLELGTTEIWNILNLTPQTHTIHLHAVKFRLLSRQSFSAEDWEAGLCRFPESNDKSDLPSCYGEVARPATAGEAGWKDTFLTTEHEVTRILVSASNQQGEELPFDATEEPGYVWHCHMAEHEDYEMMRPFRFVRATLGNNTKLES